SLEVGQIAAKGHLAEIARKKYGYRACQRSLALKRVFSDMQACCIEEVIIKSDQSHHYPHRVRRYFPRSTHITTKGRRGCVVGLGELKAGGFDPLFCLNHTYAMIRDNLKRLAR